MKKLLLSICAVLVASQSFGQTPFNQTNEPSIGETRTMYLCDSNAVDYAGIVGNGVVWNYGQTSTYNGETRLLSVVDASTTPFASDFPGATKTMIVEDFVSTYISSTSSARISQGYLVESVDLGVVKAKFTTNAQNLMSYPFSLNGTANDVFAGNLTFTYNSIPMNPTCTGNSYAKYDGFGSLVQVNNISVPNVARFHIIDTTSATLPLVGATKIIRNQYEYYNLAASNKTPIFIHAKIKMEAGFPEPLVDLGVVLSAVAGNGVAALNENSPNPFVIFPNPAQNELTIANLPTNAVVSVIDLTGRTQVIEDKGNNTFDISNMANGIFFVKIESEGAVFTEQMVKK